MKAFTELDAASAKALRQGDQPWDAPRRRWMQDLSSLWREAMATYALMARSGGYPFWGGR
jgi:hypothetical protein